MHAIDLVGQALLRMGVAVPLPEDPVQGVCCITGVQRPCIKRSLLIGESFTTQGVFKAPDSDLVGVDAWYAFKHRPERSGNWYCDGREFVIMTREEAREKIKSRVFTYGQFPWAMYVTTSFKKHGTIVAPVNQGGTMRIAFETQVVDIWGGACSTFDTDLLYWQAHGIARADLQSGYLNKTTNADADAIANFLALAPSRRHRPAYRLMAYLLPGKDAGKDAGEEIQS